MVRNFFGSISTVYVSTPTTDLQAANKAYVDSKSSSDVSFLMKKEFNGDLVTNESRRTTTGTLATLTASSGKDMYIARAKVVFVLEGLNDFSFLDTVELQINSVVVETALSSMGMASGGGGTNSTVIYEFKNVGYKVIATQVIRLQATVLNANTTLEGFVECIEVDTGVDPTL